MAQTSDILCDCCEKVIARKHERYAPDEMNSEVFTHKDWLCLACSIKELADGRCAHEADK